MKDQFTGSTRDTDLRRSRRLVRAVVAGGVAGSLGFAAVAAVSTIGNAQAAGDQAVGGQTGGSGQVSGSGAGTSSWSFSQDDDGEHELDDQPRVWQQAPAPPQPGSAQVAPHAQTAGS